MKYEQGIWSGTYEYLKTMKVSDEKKLTSIPNKKYLQSALNKLDMGDCKGSISPKLDKASVDGDNEEIDEKQTARFRSSVLTLLYLSNKRTEIQSTVRFLCEEMRQLKRLLRYVKSTDKKLEVFTDSDWASDQTMRKSTRRGVEQL